MPAPALAEATLNITMRPRALDEIVGLETQVAALRAIIDSGKLPRGFIFMGPFGCGKTTLARITAKDIQGWDFVGSPAIQEINAANITGIDAMRKLVDGSDNYPMVGKYNVIILDEAHKLSKPAQELLLKPLEVEKSPTIWMICTTEPEKLIEGILKGGRVMPIVVGGLDAAQRHTLIARAAENIGHTGDYSDFETAIAKAKIVAPRKILMAFEAYHAGIPAAQAVGSLSWEAMPEYFEICMGVVFGQWGKGYSLPWVRGKDGQPKQFPSVAEQLKSLDDRLKKKPKETGPVVETEGEPELEENDVEGRPEVAAALRAMTAATLKGQIARETKKFNMAKAVKASEALMILAQCLGPNAYGLEFSMIIGGLFRVNQKMTGGAQ